MTSALLIFLVIVIVVTSTLLYLYFNKLGPWKKGASPAPAPAPASGPTLPSITDFSVDRTLSPPKTDTYTIEPYTIEGYTQDLKELSQNVTFTLTWTNGIGFTEAKVGKIEVWHGVMTGTSFTNIGDSNDWVLRETIDANSIGYTDPLNNFATVSVKISGLSGNDAYSFEGRNFFKVVAYYPYPTNTNDLELHNDFNLYNDATSQEEKDGYGIVISSDELVGTPDLLDPVTITYEPRLDSGKGQSFSREIAKQYYDFYYYESTGINYAPTKLFSNVRLVPIGEEGIEFKLESGGKYLDVEKLDFDKNEFSGGSVVKIAESLETDTRGHEKVIMLKADFNGEDKYLFGNDGFKALTDSSWIDSNDKYFRRNIYIKKHVENST